MTRAGKHEWTDFENKLDVLPNHPFLIVVPSSLVNQVSYECNRFLETGAFDVVTYIGGYKSHKDLWNELEKRAHTVPHMRIIISSITVCPTDCMHIDIG
jgi:hypothetical protein